MTFWICGSHLRIKRLLGYPLLHCWIAPFTTICFQFLNMGAMTVFSCSQNTLKILDYYLFHVSLHFFGVCIGLFCEFVIMGGKNTALTVTNILTM